MNRDEKRPEEKMLEGPSEKIEQPFEKVIEPSTPRPEVASPRHAGAASATIARALVLGPPLAILLLVTFEAFDGPGSLWDRVLVSVTGLVWGLFFGVTAAPERWFEKRTPAWRGLSLIVTFVLSFLGAGLGIAQAIYTTVAIQSQSLADAAKAAGDFGTTVLSDNMNVAALFTVAVPFVAVAQGRLAGRGLLVQSIQSAVLAVVATQALFIRMSGRVDMPLIVAFVAFAAALGPLCRVADKVERWGRGRLRLDEAS